MQSLLWPEVPGLFTSNFGVAAICHALMQAYPTPPTGHFARHVQTLAALISGIVGGKSTQLPHIATKVPDGSFTTRHFSSVAIFHLTY